MATKRKTVADFLIRQNNKDEKLSFRLNCDFEVEFYKKNAEEEDGIYRFLCQIISIPSFRINTGQIYFHGKSIDVPINYEYDTDFDMTLYDNTTGKTYRKFIDRIRSDENFDICSDYSIKIFKGSADKQIFELKNIIIKNISSLTFSHNDATIATFILNCTTSGKNPEKLVHYLDTNLFKYTIPDPIFSNKNSSSKQNTVIDIESFKHLESIKNNVRDLSTKI